MAGGRENVLVPAKEKSSNRKQFYNNACGTMEHLAMHHG